MEVYENLLDSAYEKVKPLKACDRFEIKKVEGHIEGKKTIISNFMQIVTCLRRDPDQFAKFIFKELATSGEIAGDRLILTRKVSSESINEKIQKYINTYVSCSYCKKPDTEIVEQDGKRSIHCLACGHKKNI